MPLLDHFRPPLSERRHWHSFHNSWATYLSGSLNALLPEGYFAEANVQFGVEIDVAAFEEPGVLPPGVGWQSPPPDVSLPVALQPGVAEVGVFSKSGGPTLAGCIELVSPANKDRAAHRDALVNKCAAYLQAGVGVVLVDVVTERHADLHGELLGRLGAGGISGGAPLWLYASAYRPVERAEATVLDVWFEFLQLGQRLPTLPLWLRGGLCLPVELEATYERTCAEQRVRLTAQNR